MGTTIKSTSVSAMHVLERLQCSRSAASPNAVPAFREKFLEGGASEVEALELERGCMTATTPDMMMNLGGRDEYDKVRGGKKSHMQSAESPSLMMTEFFFTYFNVMRLHNSACTLHGMAPNTLTNDVKRCNVLICWGVLESEDLDSATWTYSLLESES